MANTPEPFPQEEPNPDALLENRKRTRTLRELRAMLRKLEHRVDEQDAEITMLRDIQGYDPDAVVKLRPKTKKEIASGQHRMAANVLLSDWHADERVDPDVVSGMNEYTMDIFRERVHAVARNIVRLVQIQRRGAMIPLLVMWLGGDLITGSIHAELSENAELGPHLEALEVLYACIELIDFLLAEGDFEEIWIPCNWGNHGRSTDRIRFATGWKHSFEFAIYEQLIRHYADEPRVKIVNGKGTFTVLTLTSDHGDKVIQRYTHGHMLRYAGGVGGISIPANKAVMRWNTHPVDDSQLVMPATVTCFGHHHQYVFGRDWVGNGSLIGVSPYGQTFAYEPPQQAFFLTDLSATELESRIVGHFPIRVT